MVPLTTDAAKRAAMQLQAAQRGKSTRQILDQFSLETARRLIHNRSPTTRAREARALSRLSAPRPPPSRRLPPTPLEAMADATAARDAASRRAAAPAPPPPSSHVSSRGLQDVAEFVNPHLHRLLRMRFASACKGQRWRRGGLRGGGEGEGGGEGGRGRRREEEAAVKKRRERRRRRRGRLRRQRRRQQRRRRGRRRRRQWRTRRANDRLGTPS